MLLVGIEVDAASMRNCGDLLTKMEIPYDPAIPLLGIYLKNMETVIGKDLCTPMSIAALSTITKSQTDLSVCRQIDKNIVEYMFNVILLSDWKSWSSSFCLKIDGS